MWAFLGPSLLENSEIISPDRAHHHSGGTFSVKRNVRDGRQRLQLCHSPPAIVSVSSTEQSALFAIFEESRGRQLSSGSGSARASPSTKAFVGVGLAAKGSKSLSTTPVREIMRSPAKHCAVKANANIGPKSALSPPKHVHNIPPTTSVITPAARYATAAASGSSGGGIPLIAGLTHLRLMPNLLAATAAAVGGLGSSPFGEILSAKSTATGGSELGKRASPVAALAKNDVDNNNDAPPPAKCSKTE